MTRGHKIVLTVCLLIITIFSIYNFLCAVNKVPYVIQFNKFDKQYYDEEYVGHGIIVGKALEVDSKRNITYLYLLRYSTNPRIEYWYGCTEDFWNAITVPEDATCTRGLIKIGK